MSFAEAKAFRVRQVLAGVWLAIIASLFIDPFTPLLTGPDSPLPVLAPSADHCVLVQGHCVASTAYPLGAPLYWGLLLPLLIATLFLFGHELWRRVCPLSFFSQIGRNLGLVRRRRTAPRGGAMPASPRPAKVRAESFLARHHFTLQLLIFFLSLCARILFVNADRLFLALFMLAFIIAALIVGFLYDGKAWCQYFCPVAVVEEFYTGPRGLFASRAHVRSNPASKVTQSMCRTLPAEGEVERSACVACVSHCIDIDAEKSYWLSLMTPRKQRLVYGYAGLVFAYFGYYYLFAGNWWYYLSGIWSHESWSASHLWASGLYVFGHPLPLPKLIAVPLVLAAGLWGGMGLGSWLEARLLAWQSARGSQGLSPEIVRHRCFTVTVVAVFNGFFVFAGHNFLYMLPMPLPVYLPALLCGISGMWLYRTWRRTPEAYSAEVIEQKRSRRGSLVPGLSGSGRGG